MVQSLFLINTLVLGVAGVGCLIRLVAGPTVLDRAVAIDVLTAVVIGLAAWVLVTADRPDVGIIIMTLTMVAFVSSTVIGRFARRYRARSEHTGTPGETEGEEAP